MQLQSSQRPDSNEPNLLAGVETIDPDKARFYLSQSAENRKLNSVTVALYASAMQRGEWISNGESIKFDRDGRLFDGQHRLQAIIKADVSVPLLVIRGLRGRANELIEFVDHGRKRSLSDHLTMRGESNTYGLASSLRLLSTWEKYGSFRSYDPLEQPSIHQLLVLLQDNPALPESYKMGLLAYFPRSGCSASLLGVCHYIFSSIDEGSCEDANVFLDRLASGQELSTDNPIYLLRQRMIDTATERTRRKPGTYEWGALVIKSWNYFRRGEALKTLRFHIGGARPEAYPVPE